MSIRCMRYAIIYSILLYAVLFGIVKLARGEAYQKYRKDACEWCEKTEDLEVHHVITQREIEAKKLDKKLISDPGNLITLCRLCHYVVGHRRDWKKNNHAIKAMLIILETEKKLIKDDEATVTGS